MELAVRELHKWLQVVWEWHRSIYVACSKFIAMILRSPINCHYRWWYRHLASASQLVRGERAAPVILCREQCQCGSMRKPCRNHVSMLCNVHTSNLCMYVDQSYYVATYVRGVGSKFDWSGKNQHAQSSD